MAFYTFSGSMGSVFCSPKTQSKNANWLKKENNALVTSTVITCLKSWLFVYKPLIYLTVSLTLITINHSDQLHRCCTVSLSPQPLHLHSVFLYYLHTFNFQIFFNIPLPFQDPSTNYQHPNIPVSLSFFMLWNGKWEGLKDALDSKKHK